MVAAIGRGVPSNAGCDLAVSRLLDRFRLHPAGPVPVLSLLYQCHGASAALIAATILARHRHEPRRSAIEQTVRMTSVDTPIGDRVIVAGRSVVLDLKNSGFEFGAGRHESPGRNLAEAIFSGMVKALTAQGYHLLPNLVEYAPDRRPRALPMERQARDRTMQS